MTTAAIHARVPVDLVACHVPDRLARKLANQTPLYDELENPGTEVRFMKARKVESPEDEMPLQFLWGMVEHGRDAEFDIVPVACAATRRHALPPEPEAGVGAGIPHAGICAMGHQRGRSVPQPGPSTAPSCMPSHGASTSISCDGLCRRSSISEAHHRRRGGVADVRQRAPKVFAHWQIARITNSRPMGALCPETVTHGPQRAGGGTSLPPLT